MVFVSPSCENVDPEEDEVLDELDEGSTACDMHKVYIEYIYIYIFMFYINSYIMLTRYCIPNEHYDHMRDVLARS